MIDIISSSADPRAVRLSNFTSRLFMFEAVQCGSLEGFLQSLKATTLQQQWGICALSGIAAQRAGRNIVGRLSGRLSWKGKSIERGSQQYIALMTHAYNAAYEQDHSFRNDLLATEHEELRHLIGGSDPNQTVLTEVEFIYQLYRLRARAHREPAPQMDLQGIREALPTT